MSSLPEQGPEQGIDQEPGEVGRPLEVASAFEEPRAAEVPDLHEWIPGATSFQASADGSETPFLDAQLSPEPQPLLPVAEPDRPLFQSFSQPENHPLVRIPHLGHVAMLAVFACFGLLGAGVAIFAGLHYHLYGVTGQLEASTEIHYALGSEIILYALMYGASALFFPLIWHKGFFAGIQWNGATALRLRRRLFVIASVCCALALANGLLLPGPKDAPIEKIFRAPGAAWMMFAFGVTIAPFFEELIFRGFLLPALCTAWDWAVQRSTGKAALPLDENGQPHWSMFAMVVGSILTSLPFAGMHAAQTGYSWGPFVLLVGVSLVLCWARLSTRSLAASVLVHASYNFLIFSLMLIGTGGFRHLDRM